ncbi:hypothetical protein ACGFIZ_33870, partial [Micromonospora sp. NPDC048830]
TLPMSGPVPAPPAGTGLPGLPGPLDDPNAPTTSSWPAWPAASSWPAGWTEPAEPVPGSGVTDGHYGAAMSTDPGQQRIGNQAGEGSGNPGDWATYQGTDMDWQPSPAVTRTDAGTLHAGDTLHHPADEPPTTPAPLHPDQPQPQPTADSWVRDPDRARTLFNQHAGHIATTTQQQEELRLLWNALIGRMDGDGLITVSEQALADATSTLRRTVHDRIGALRDRRLLQVVPRGHGSRTARYKVTDPGPPRQASLPALPAGSQWVRDPDGARTLFNQHAGHIATTTQREEQPLRQLWNALIDSMDGDGIITASERALARAAGTWQSAVNDRIRVLRNYGLLQLVKEHDGGVAARYRVTDPGPPRQAPVPGPAPGPDRPQGSADLSWLNHGDTSPMPGPVPAPPAGTGLPGLPGPLDDPNAPTASSWPAGWTGPAGPGPGSGATDGHYGAAMSTYPGQQRIGNQAGDGSGNLDAWATYQVDPADPLDLFDLFDPLHPAAWVGPPTALDTEPDPGPQPMDPPLPQAPPDPTSWSQPSGDQPSQFPGTQSFPPGLGVPDPAPPLPMPGPVPAPPADTGLPGLPGPLDDPNAPTASSWPEGWTGPAGPNPDIDVTAHGAGMSTHPGQPPVDNQPDDGSGNPGAWATWQGPDMRFS